MSGSHSDRTRNADGLIGRSGQEGCADRCADRRPERRRPQPQGMGLWRETNADSGSPRPRAPTRRRSPMDLEPRWIG
jgi:hypothetical protein